MLSWAAALSTSCNLGRTDTSERSYRGLGFCPQWLVYKARASKLAALGGVTLLCPAPLVTLRPFGTFTLQVQALHSDSSTLFQIPAGSLAFEKFGDNFVNS